MVAPSSGKESTRMPRPASASRIFCASAFGFFPQAGRFFRREWLDGQPGDQGGLDFGEQQLQYPEKGFGRRSPLRVQVDALGQFFVGRTDGQMGHSALLSGGL